MLENVSKEKLKGWVIKIVIYRQIDALRHLFVVLK